MTAIRRIAVNGFQSRLICNDQRLAYSSSGVQPHYQPFGVDPNVALSLDAQPVNQIKILKMSGRRRLSKKSNDIRSQLASEGSGREKAVRQPPARIIIQSLWFRIPKSAVEGQRPIIDVALNNESACTNHGDRAQRRQPTMNPQASHAHSSCRASN